MSAQPTQSEIEILRYAMGLTDAGRGRAYRVHYVSFPYPGSKKFEDCESLVRAGYMLRASGPSLCDGGVLFTVTTTGDAAARVKRKKE